MQGSPSVRSDPPRWQVPRLAKDDRVVAGVAGGVAREVGVDPVVVRVGFVVLAAAGGVGLVLYAVLWVVMRQHAERHADEAYVPRPKGASEGGRIAGVACIVVGLLIASQSLGFGLGIADSLVWPVALVAAGLVVALRRSERGPQAWAGDAARAVTTDRLGLARVLGGLVLVGGGIATLLATAVDPAELWTVALAVVVTVAGVGLVVAPWGWRIVGELTEERRRRIRSDERAAMAVHLHDSVLQTLALIQRNAHDPALAAQLARRQERELRTWLYEGDRRPERSYRTAFEDLALDVEELHRVPVEVVVVGDAQVGERDEALVAAAREAVVNASQHAGADRVDVYVEVGEELREAYVRDTGAGFDRTAVPPGRRGIADSIVGRMERAGGTAEIDSTPGAGTEVHLRLPVEVPTLKPRIVLVDDHAIVRAGIRSELGDRVEVVGEAGDVDEAVRVIAGAQPDVVLLDVHLPGGSGAAVIEAARRVGAEPRYLALSVSDAAEDVIAVIRAGARGYVTKAIGTDALADAIVRVAGGEAVLSPRLAGFVLDAFAGAPALDDADLDALTPRERDVLRLLARGYAYKEIARRLSISVKTVESHASAVLRKLQLTSRHELTRWAADRRV